MTLRCGCEREGDATVFGDVHECTVDPRPPANLPRFAPSWVVPPEPRYMETLDPEERGGH